MGSGEAGRRRRWGHPAMLQMVEALPPPISATASPSNTTPWWNRVSCGVDKSGNVAE